MSEGRVKKSSRNISVGLIATVINTITAFIGRKAFVVFLGSDALGINGLFTEVIAILSLTELGVGMAIVYNLYKPLSDHDEQKISQLMSLYRTAYNIIAVVILVLGLAITPVVHKLITEVNYPLSYIRLIFILFVIKTSSSYLFSYKTSLLNADQKQYVVSFVTMVGKAVFTVVSIIVLWMTKNYIIYLILTIIQTILTNIVLSFYVDKHYPYLDYSQHLSEEERNKVFDDVKNLFLKKVSGGITNSTDNILISKLVSTIQSGLYSNYVLVFSGVRTLRIAFTNGLAASIGELSVSEEVEKCIQVLRRLTYIYYLFAIVASSVLFAVCDHFIEFCFGNVYVMEKMVVVIATFVLYLEICSDPLWQYLEVSGLFKQDKYIGLAGSVINLIVSIVLGLKIGISGIFIGTVCTQLVQLILKTNLLFREKYHVPSTSYYLMWIKLLASFILLCLVKQFILDPIIIENLFLAILVKGIVGLIIGILFSVIPFYGTEEFSYSISLFTSFVQRSRKS